MPLTDALAASMRDPSPGSTAGDNNALPSGFTFFGQFVDHDLTMDREVLGNQQADPNGSTNFRSPMLNLDSVYNTVQPDGVSAGAVFDGQRFRLEVNANGVLDLPRNADGTAKLAEPRNEENLLICQLHIAFMRFHNRLVDEGHSFEEAQRQTRWHYQWVVMTDFLPRMAGRERVDRVLQLRPRGAPKVKTRFYTPQNRNRVFMPLEFAVAAFRFGHTQVRNNYNPNLNIRVAIQQPVAGPGNLNGFRPIPAALAMDFRSFFHFADSPDPAVPPLFNSTRRMDAVLSPNLLNLPVASLPNAPTRTSLAARNLERGVQVGLPSGQAVARAIGAPVLDNGSLRPGAAVLADPGFAGEAPLWFYLLAESDVAEGAVRLGEVGATLIVETLAGIMDADQTSFFHSPAWRPMTPTFRAQEFFAYAGVGGILPPA
ncbi:MAG: peroxidase family protein [Dehalococcoidia bacterium]